MECTKERAKHKPFRQKRKPTPFCVIDRSNIAKTSQRIEVRIMEIRRSLGAGTYVFIDKDDRAYLLPDTKTCADEWVLAFFSDLVGYYDFVSRRGLPILKPTLEGITEDITDHLRGLV
jgi:hypothetical protein